MNQQMNDGGPAFPVGHPEMAMQGQAVKETQGMTLRDYFAAKAMQGICAHRHNGTLPSDKLAQEAYSIADAMISLRDGGS